jgi:hypothetical protein
MIHNRHIPTQIHEVGTMSYHTFCNDEGKDYGSFEVFHIDRTDIAEEQWLDDNGDLLDPGWYWWACFPGCLPDSEPCGPFNTSVEAYANARD